MVKRLHTLYLQSKYREAGTPSRYTISLPEVIQSDPNLERFKLTLQSFSTYNSFYIIKEGCNTITKDDTPFIIPNGNYTYQRLARYLSALLDCTVSWLQDSNKMKFEFDTSTTLLFDNIAAVLGFEKGVDYTGTTITSTVPMTPYESPHLVVQLLNICPVADNLCFSNYSGEVRIDNILGKVLINASPFQLITYQQVLESEGIFTNDNSLGALEFYITDCEGNEFTDIPEHEITLTVESVDLEDPDMKALYQDIKQIKIILQDLFIMKSLGKRTKY